MPLHLPFGAHWTTFLDNQHRYPSGLIGQLIGERMVRQHAPETRWTVDQLGIAPSDRVLELGFGAGRGLELATQAAWQGTVIGVDLSPTMVRAARRRNRAAMRAGRVGLLGGDVTALPFAGPSFNKIYSIHTFYFWTEPLQLLRELLHLLKPGGVLMVTLSTGHTTSAGEIVYSDLHHSLNERILPALKEIGVLRAELLHGPDSRQYNNVALVVDV